jgi:hypothetical protein
VLPDFRAPCASWNATHVVVATEGESVDGVLTVIESWKGTLKAGETVTVPQLKVFAPAKERTIRWEYRRLADAPEHVTGARMVLFLVKDGARWESTVRGEGMHISVAWVEHGKVYAFQQELAWPHHVVLVPLTRRTSGKDVHLTENELRAEAAELTAVQAEIAGANALPTPDERVAALVPLLQRHEYYRVASTVLEGLAECGPVGLARLRRMFDGGEPRVLPYDVAFWMATVPAGRQVLREILRRERESLPRAALVPGPAGGHEAELRRVAARLSVVLEVLAPHVDPECRPPVRELHAFLSALPEHSGTRELKSLISGCRNVLDRFKD